MSDHRSEPQAYKMKNVNKQEERLTEFWVHAPLTQEFREIHPAPVIAGKLDVEIWLEQNVSTLAKQSLLR